MFVGGQASAVPGVVSAHEGLAGQEKTDHFQDSAPSE